MMKQRGLTFCQELVPKVLEGSKFVTRRLGGLKYINENPDFWNANVNPELDGTWLFWGSDRSSLLNIKCRQGVAGDRFYMQEAWGLLYPTHNPFNHRAAVYAEWRAAADPSAGPDRPHSLIPVYKADHITGNDGPGKIRWRSGRFQPKWACRSQRWELVSIRPERLHQITVEDIIAEGLSSMLIEHDACVDLRENFKALWDKINAKRGYPFERNNWVWREEWNPEAVIK